MKAMLVKLTIAVVMALTLCACACAQDFTVKRSDPPKKQEVSAKSNASCANGSCTASDGYATRTEIRESSNGTVYRERTRNRTGFLRRLFGR